MKRSPVCYLRVITRDNLGTFHAQEWYESSTRDAGRRARVMRKAGYKVFSASMGSQITDVGRVNMTLVTICWNDYGQEPPAPCMAVR